MLVLSRKKNQSIVINGDITIVVVEIRGDKVRLGVEAPKEIPVHRKEVHEAIRREIEAGNKSNDVAASSDDVKHDGLSSGDSATAPDQEKKSDAA